MNNCTMSRRFLLFMYKVASNDVEDPGKISLIRNAFFELDV